MAVGGTTYNLFCKNGTLRKGKKKLKIWANREADGNQETTTPGKTIKSSELDRLEQLINEYERNEMEHLAWLDKLAFQQIEKINRLDNSRSDHMWLYIELPTFPHDIIFHEKEAVIHTMSSSSLVNALSEVFTVPDPEMNRENPIETKYRKLARSVRRGMMDRDLKPNAMERKQINAIINHPPTRDLTSEEKDLLWKFRFSLTREKKVLTKFLKCVDWNDKYESTEAISLLDEWAPIDVDDALELLSAQFKTQAVRNYAVRILGKAEDEELLDYLLQLVQAVRYESYEKSDLSEFLVKRCAQNMTLGHYFTWYVRVAKEDKQYTQMFNRLWDRYSMQLLNLPNDDGTERLLELERQTGLVAELGEMMSELKASKDPRPKKIEQLRVMLQDDAYLSESSLDRVCLPVDPSVQVTGVVPHKANIFKSALNPLLIHFVTQDRTEENPYAVIFKHGDDLRQDQLVIQLISLMDKLLKKENLDLQLTPYKVLATSSNDGFVEFIPSKAMAAVLADYKQCSNPIQGYFAENNPDPNEEFGVEAEVMDRYIRSCAGYSVITYLLGVGDRHLDNLMLKPDGSLFHVDFGFLLGRDPKPFPPPMKLCKEMVEAMGGADSKSYRDFKSLCCEAFNILRKSANLILNLFELMNDANIPDLALEPDKSVLKVQEKFRLDLTDEEALEYFQTLINDSVSALFPQMVETIHRWAQYWRS
eukprot:TRINITY_DN698_c1_g1_i1.p1 TRINITY_DN698_c1_g1~~TRINITY_DN698_c1_g1_i1.p1  ORF type:complete len:705 (+),score=236.36 TRINITY_DN698_c1_g1_i1:789-2903(+)